MPNRSRLTSVSSAPGAKTIEREKETTIKGGYQMKNYDATFCCFLRNNIFNDRERKTKKRKKKMFPRWRLMFQEARRNLRPKTDKVLNHFYYEWKRRFYFKSSFPVSSFLFFLNKNHSGDLLNDSSLTLISIAFAIAIDSRPTKDSSAYSKQEIMFN